MSDFDTIHHALHDYVHDIAGDKDWPRCVADADDPCETWEYAEDLHRKLGLSRSVIDVEKPVPPLLWSDEPPIHIIHFADWQSAMEAAHACTVLAIGWRLDHYYGPISDKENKEEYRLYAWRNLQADCVVRSPDWDDEGDEHPSA